MKRIATRLIAWFLLISVVPLAVVAVLAQTNAERNLRSEIENHLRATANSKAQQIHAFFRERVKDVETLVRNPAVANALNDLGDAFNDNGLNSPEYAAADEKVRPFLMSYICAVNAFRLPSFSQQRTSVARRSTTKAGVVRWTNRPF